MYIYIDESGTFVCPSARSNSVSCIAALVVPESRHDELLDKTHRMRSLPRTDQGEIKGRLLSESDVSQTVSMLERHDSILLVAAIDMGLETPDQIVAHRDQQAGLMIDNIEHLHPRFQADIRALASRLSELPPQLYTQLTLLCALVEDVVQVTTLEFSQAMPAELGRFAWRIDAKDSQVTEYEELWTKLVLPMLQSSSLKSPLVQIRQGDYSSFARFENPPEAEPPQHLREAVRSVGDTFLSFDIKRLMQDDLSFDDSVISVGLQLSDILANAFRRGCNGKLRRRGWRNLGRLMIKHCKRRDALTFRTLSGPPDRKAYWPYVELFRELERKARPFAR